MRKSLVLLLYVAALSFSFNGAATAAQCQMALLGNINVEFNEGGMVFVPIKFEGRDVWMVLAMSYGLPMLYRDAVAELGLESRLSLSGWKASSGGQPITKQVEAKSLMIAGANFTGWKLLVLPENSPPVSILMGKPVVGVLTSAFMNAVDVEFDLAARQMRLFKHKDCGGPPAHWEGEATSTPLYVDGAGLLVFSMELDGQKVEASLNTSSKRSTLSSRVSREYFGFDENSPDINKETVGADSEIVSFRAMSLTAQGLNVRNSPVTLQTGDKCRASTKQAVQTGKRIAANRSSSSIGYANCMSKTPFTVGTDVLRKVRVYIASDEKVMYFQAAAKPAELASQ